MARSQWFASVVSSVVLVGVLIWLSLTDPTPSAYPPSAPAPSGAAPTLLDQLASAKPRPSIDTSAAKEVVAELRQERLSLPPRTQPAPQLAVSGTRVGSVGRDRFRVVEPGTSREPLEFPLLGAQSVLRVPGALLAVGSKNLLLLSNASKRPESWPRVTLLPGSRLLPDRIDPGRLWAWHTASSSLFGYRLEDRGQPLLPLTHQVELRGPSPRLLLGLDDGSFIYHTGDSWERMFVQGRRFALHGLERDGAVRTLRAGRLDQFFVVFEAGQVERVQIQERLRTVWRTELGELPLDIASWGDRLVLLRHHPSPSGLHWQLEVRQPKQAESTILELENSPRSQLRGDWVATLLASHALTTSKHWIVLGGMDSVRVWDRALKPVVVPH